MSEEKVIKLRKKNWITEIIVIHKKGSRKIKRERERERNN